ncbi:MAG: NAD(P)H-dependent oxidoreductase [Firmicutes bacterium]|nr:NAD(P)H-dependent oxidoreductase [Bacillota bacterium]NLP37403.1 NAD(P)H-dependent oxidoreductase [Bacillota bacterium]
MADKIKIVGFTGSLRKNSYNLAALRAAATLLPEEAELEILDISALPFFNEDVEAEGVPEVVHKFKEKLAAADAVLLATPEYNYSLPPALKNALDWASRGDYNPLANKPTAIMSASIGMFGGARAQYHLRQVCVRLNAQVLNQPEVFIANAGTKFAEDGTLTDERTQNSIKRLLKALIEKVKA